VYFLLGFSNVRTNVLIHQYTRVNVSLNPQLNFYTSSSKTLYSKTIHTYNPLKTLLYYVYSQIQYLLFILFLSSFATYWSMNERYEYLYVLQGGRNLMPKCQPIFLDGWHPRIIRQEWLSLFSPSIYVIGYIMHFSLHSSAQAHLSTVSMCLIEYWIPPRRH